MSWEVNVHQKRSFLKKLRFSDFEERVDGHERRELRVFPHF